MSRLGGVLCLATVLWVGTATWGAGAQETVRYVHTDALGSPVAESDEDGNIVVRYDYEPYGASIGEGIEDGPGFTGHVSDASTGLIYMQQRYYDPELGMFLSVDPVTAYTNPVAQFNVYRYGNGSPFTFVDPDGRSGCTGTRITSVCNGGGVAGLQTSARTTGEVRASTQGETLRINISQGIDGNRVLGPGGKGLLHYFADDAVDALGFAVDGHVGPALKSVALGFTLKRLGPLGGKLGDAAGSLGVNPFRGKAARDIAEMLTKKGYVPRGPDPVSGRGTFVNPRTGRGYHIDLAHPEPKGPHVGIHRPRGLRDVLEPRDYPIGN